MYMLRRVASSMCGIFSPPHHLGAAVLMRHILRKMRGTANLDTQGSQDCNKHPHGTNCTTPVLIKLLQKGGQEVAFWGTETEKRYLSSGSVTGTGALA